MHLPWQDSSQPCAAGHLLAVSLSVVLVVCVALQQPGPGVPSGALPPGDALLVVVLNVMCVTTYHQKCMSSVHLSSLRCCICSMHACNSGHQFAL